MTTATRLRCLCGWSIRCVSVAISLAVCASVFADPSKNVVGSPKHPTKRNVQKVCYTFITGSAIPQPCDRLGRIPTTASQLSVIGSAPEGK